MEIRNLRMGDDLLSVSRVYAESWKSAYHGLLPQDYLDNLSIGRWVPNLKQPGRNSLILLDDVKIVGAASYCSSRVPELAGWGEIISIYLLPDYWGKGYGRKLFSAAVKGLESMGYWNIFLWVLESNWRARSFYERMGFQSHEIFVEDTIGGMVVREVQYRRESRAENADDVLR